MWRKMLTGCVSGCCLLIASVANAQDSGPGPDAAGGDRTYDVTVIRFPNFSTGTFTFTADSVITPEGSSPAVTTTGTFNSVVGTENSTGTWHAVDLGNFALWYAQASGTSTQSTAVGYATPDMIVGRQSTTSTTASGRSRFLRALFHSSFFFGTAAEVIPMDPTTAN